MPDRTTILATDIIYVVASGVWYKATFTEVTTLLAGTFAPLASPTLTGTVTIPTPSTADNSTKAASTAYVQAQGYLVNSNNLSDLSNAGTARTNLGVSTMPLSVGVAAGQLPVVNATTGVRYLSGSYT